METSNLTCPHCGVKKEIEIPESECMRSMECESYHKIIISSKKDSDHCTCVICEFTDKKCPSF